MVMPWTSISTSTKNQQTGSYIYSDTKVKCKMYLGNGKKNNFVASYLYSITRIEAGVAITTCMLPQK